MEDDDASEQRDVQRRAAYEAMKANPPALPESFRVRYGEGMGRMREVCWRRRWNDEIARVTLEANVPGNHDGSYDGSGDDAAEAVETLLRNIGQNEPLWEVVPAGEFSRAELMEQAAQLHAKLEAIERSSESNCRL